MSKILLIDDDVELRALLKLTLERAGHSVTEANNGHQGMAYFKESPADLVITDIVMPEQEGIETIYRMQKDYPDLPIIAISAYWQKGQNYLQYAEKLGVSHALKKPIAPEALLACVDEALGN